MKTLMLSLATALLIAGCSDDESSATPPAADTGTTATDTGGAPADTGGTPTDTGGAADTAMPADTGPMISSDSNAPTKLEIGKPVTATLAADQEHFFEYTPSEAGDHTLHFTSPAKTWYASQSPSKGSHVCGLPECVLGTGTAKLSALMAGTTYYLNLYNGTSASGSYTLQVTKP